MEQILVSGISVDELAEKISKKIESKLAKTEPAKNNQVILLSRFEVSKLLKISLPTLHDWTKRGILLSYKIGTRVLYKLKEVEEAIEKSPIAKHKKTTH